MVIVVPLASLCFLVSIIVVCVCVCVVVVWPRCLLLLLLTRNLQLLLLVWKCIKSLHAHGLLGGVDLVEDDEGEHGVGGDAEVVGGEAGA